jgi:hypothetical protein
MNGDLQLLADRLEFLTSNYRIESTRGNLHGGIYYNFSLYKPHENGEIFKGNRLEALDAFLREALRPVIAASAVIERGSVRALLRFSFVMGHRSKKMSEFSPKRIKELRNCWRDL